MAVAGSSAGLLIGGTQHAGYVDAGGHPESLEGGAQHLGGAFPAPAPSAERTVDLQRSVLLGQHRVRHAEREVLVPVEPHLSLGADLIDQCRDAGLRIT